MHFTSIFMLQLKEPKDLIPMKNTVINIVKMYFVKLYMC